MAMLEYNEIRQRKFIIFEGEPYEVLDSHVFRKQQRKPVNQTKLKNMISGRIVEHSFHQSDKAVEAEMETKQIKYLYSNPKKNEIWFCYENKPGERFALSEDIIGPALKFLKENTIVNALTFEDRIIGIKLPIKVELKVTEAPPTIKGNTAQGGNKQVTLETGANVNVPLFINEGDIITVNTETGEYTDRVSK
ncbi:MAG: elongation factor P [Parcubacteria group bacterium]|nr:elongation factor P [Parcubacteria group bacterium]MCR4342488.1 elongation factor P [Patescibacteria group bacterium]